MTSDTTKPEERATTKCQRSCVTDSENAQTSESGQDECSSKSLSVTKVREELQNVIERMGTNVKLSKEPENEEDTSVSVNSYVKSTTSDDISAISSLQDDSIITEYNVSELVAHNYENKYKSTDVAAQTSDYKLICPGYLRQDINPQCICTHLHTCNIKNVKDFVNTSNPTVHKVEERSRLEKFLGNIWPRQSAQVSKYTELYNLEIENSPDEGSPPRKMLIKMSNQVPKPEVKSVGINTHHIKHYIKREKITRGMHAHVPRNDYKAHLSKNEQSSHVSKNDCKTYSNPSNLHADINSNNNHNHRKSKHTASETLQSEPSVFREFESEENIDIYYFDHGNSAYYRTTDAPPVIMTEILAQRTEHYTRRFWAQIFGTIHIGVSFVTSFFLQLFRFILYAIVRPLLIGLTQLLSDYFIKPCLATLFNSIIQPPMIFLYNFAISVRDVCHPIAQSIGYFIREFAVLIESFRLLQIINHSKCSSKKDDCPCKESKGLHY